MNKGFFFVAATAMVVLAGCNDYVTPAGVVATAYESLEKGDLKAFNKALTGKALETYGTAQGAAALKGRLAGLTVSMSKPEMVSTVAVPNTNPAQQIRTYTVNVLGKSAGEAQPARVVTVTVTCTDYDLGQPVDQHIRGEIPVDPNEPNYVTQCWVADLQ